MSIIVSPSPSVLRRQQISLKQGKQERVGKGAESMLGLEAERELAQMRRRTGSDGSPRLFRLGRDKTDKALSVQTSLRRWVKNG